MHRFRWINQASRIVKVLMVAMTMQGVSVAFAQAFPGLPPGFGEALQPDFYARDQKFFIDDLQLDDGQKAVLESLFSDYETAFKAGADKVRGSVGSLDPAGEIESGTRDQRKALIQRELEGLVDKVNEDEPAESAEERASRVAQIKVRIDQLRQQLKEINPDPPRGDELHLAFERLAANLQTWQAEKVRLRDQFITNVQAVLSEEQKKRWPALSRKLNREHTLNKGRLSGESIDLIRVVKELNFTPEVSAAISPILAEYDLRLDAALQARNSEVEKSQGQLMQAMQLRDAAMTASITESVMKTRVAVRNVNDEYAALIAAKLPTTQAELFTATVQTRAYPRVYRSTQTQRLFKAAQELEDLEPTTLAAIRDLEKEFLAALGPANDKVRDVVRSSEVTDQMRLAQQRLNPNRGTPTPADDPIGRAFQERNQLGQGFSDRLKALLTADQWEQLPTGQVIRDQTPR